MRAAVLSTGSIDSVSVVNDLIFKVTRSSVDLDLCAMSSEFARWHDGRHANGQWPWQELVEHSLGVCGHGEIIWVKIFVFKESLAYISLDLA